MAPMEEVITLVEWIRNPSSVCFRKISRVRILVLVHLCFDRGWHISWRYNFVLAAKPNRVLTCNQYVKQSALYLSQDEISSNGEYGILCSPIVSPPPLHA